jgi:hypothetical protein
MNLSNTILHRHRLSENTCEICGASLYIILPWLSWKGCNSKHLKSTLAMLTSPELRAFSSSWPPEHFAYWPRTFKKKIFLSSLDLFTLRRTRSKVWRLQGIYAISSKFGRFPVNISVVVAREACKQAWLQGPSAAIAPQAACLVNTVPYRAIRYSLHTFDWVLRTL